MDRRDSLRILGSIGALATVPSWRMRLASRPRPVRFEVHGKGPALILGPPVTAAREGPLAEQLAAIRQAHLERLTDSYRVIVMDYPPSGGDLPPADSFTVDRVCADVLGVADAAGADRFAWYGFSWGGVIGLQLAARTDRLTALICGGWPPLGAPYRELLALSEALAAQAGPNQAAGRLYVTFYRGLQSWAEQEAVSRFSCPRMTFAGKEDVVVALGQTARIGPTIAERREELERMGWTVRLVDGFKQDLAGRADVVMPLVREFLDPLLLGR